MDPERADAYAGRGLIRHQAGDYEGALADYNKALELNPDDAELYFGRAVLREEQGKADLALSDYDRAIEFLPDDEEIAERKAARGGLTRPEYAVLFSYAKLGLYDGSIINLDFHTVPHYGDESVLETHWAGARGKRMKGALTLFAQDAESKLLVYTAADIQRAEADSP